MRKLILAVAGLGLFASAVYAADPIAERKALMKANAQAVGTLVPMIKGAKPFDRDAAMAALTKLRDDGAKMDFATLWPEGSDKGDTASSPKIWEDKAGFQAQIDKFKADTAAAVEANPQDLAALKAQFAAITANCGSCHQAYRLSKN